MEPKPKQRYHCGHCDADLSKTQFYRHKSLYYDQRSRKWSSSQLPKSNSDDIPFSLSSSEEEPDYAASFSLDIDDGENTSSKGEVKQFDFVGE